MAYAFEDKTGADGQRIELTGRGALALTGVVDVESFDEQTVVLHTVRGTLIVRGRDLHMQMLSLEGGQISIDGVVDALAYEDDGRESGGLFSRLFR